MFVMATLMMLKSKFYPKKEMKMICDVCIYVKGCILTVSNRNLVEGDVN